jgi:uncharacterized protein (DUF952 family)
MGCAYKPGAFDQDGFIHCTGDRETLLAVANDYFASVSEPVLVLVIETARVQAEVRLEPAAPVQGGGTSHLQGAALFPHIYGPLNLDAVVEIGALRRSGGTYAWPDRFVPPDRWPSL